MMMATEVIGRRLCWKLTCGFCIHTRKNQREARWRGKKGLSELNKNENIEEREKEKTSPTSEITTLQDGKEENKLKAQGDTQRQKVDGDKGSGA